MQTIYTKHFLCDLDGVLVDFVNPSLAIHNRFDMIANPKHPLTYNYWDEMRLHETTFWSPIEKAGPSWWANLPPLPWMEKLAQLLSFVDPDWSIATKPYNADSCAGKWAWSRAYCGGRRLHITTDKSELFKPGRVLIDDSEVNIQRWRQLGGEAILFPCTYNSNREHLGREFEYTREEIYKLNPLPFENSEY